MRVRARLAKLRGCYGHEGATLWATAYTKKMKMGLMLNMVVTVLTGM